MFRLAFYLLPLLLCMRLHAQVLPFKNYGIKDGLNDNNVQAVIRDDRGLLWLGTDFGVYWFDGKRFYRPPIKTNIGQLYVNNFYKDSSGAIWVLTFFNGMYKYQNGVFTNYLVDTVLKDPTTNSVSQIVQLRGGKYIVIGNGRPYWFDGRKFTVFDSSNALQGSGTNYVTLLSQQTLLLSTEHGIFVYRSDNGHFKLAGRALNDLPIGKIVVTDKQLWVNSTDGIISFDNDTDLSFSKPSAWYLTGKGLKDAAVDKNGRIWASSDTAYKIENGQVTKYTAANGLPENIQSIYADNEGIVWFANSRGVSMLGDDYYEFTPLRNGISGEFAGPVNTDLQNNIWIGTDNGLAIRKNSGYEFINKIGNDTLGFISAFCKTKKGVLLAATNAGVLSVEENAIKKEINIRATAITEDETGRIWLADNIGNIWVSGGKSMVPMNMDHFKPEMITCLFVVNGSVWAGYRSSGIRKYRLDKDRLLLAREYNPAAGFNDLRVRCCAADAKGNIIFGTRTNGVFIFSATADTLIAHINILNGLNANWIKDIVCDAFGTVYLATNNGINILSGNYKKPVVKQLKINNERINRETNSIFKTGNTFYIGTNEGLLKWMPGNMHKDTAAPPVYFTHIDIQGLPDFAIDPYTQNAGQISLPYDQHVISFEFAGISLRNPENVRYQYMLVGQDKDWGPLTEHNYVAYNLKPGSYTFTVLAKNTDGIASLQPAVFHFVIKPPLWDSWWFITGCVILLMLIAYTAYRYNVNRLLELERLRNKISTDLHDDIGSTLSSISILSNMALKESSNAQVLEMLRGISENSTSLLEKMDDIVWSINPQNDTFENLVERLRRFAAVLLEAKNIEYTIEIEPSVKNIKLSMDYRQHIYMILKETINNLVKYAHCTRAYIGVTYQNNYLEITVKDNGAGFDQQNAQYGNGILNMKRRAKQMKAAIAITSQQGIGTEIRIKLKIK